MMTRNAQYTETIKQKLERQRKELRKSQQAMERKNKEAKREMLGMAVVVPTGFALMLLFYVFAWFASPSSLW